MPQSRIWRSASWSSSTVAPTHVKCAMASRPWSALMRLTMSIVFSRVEPPAPQVTETKLGSSGRSAWSASKRLRSPSSVCGGKNSNEKTGSVALASASSIRIGEL